MADESPTIIPEFDAIYRGESTEDTGMPFDFAPWDIGEPQPALVELERAGNLRSEVLDAGCGPGDNALFLAERGYRATGFDFSPTAIEQAKERANTAGLHPELLVADATRLDGLDQRFTTVLDSALYHCLPDDQRSAYAAALHRVTNPGAELHLMCSADVDRPGVWMPMRETPENLRAHLGEHWDIQSIELTRYSTAMTLDYLAKFNPGELDDGDMPMKWDDLRTDENGRVTMPIWHLHAVRR